MSKVCKTCSLEKSVSCFYLNSKTGMYFARCKECCQKAYHARYLSKKDEILLKAKSYRQTQARKEYLIRYQSSEENRQKRRARYAVSNAIRDGRLHRGNCEVCDSSEKIEAHHPDYSDVLNVKWLCRQHHMEEHDKPFLKEETDA